MVEDVVGVVRRLHVHQPVIDGVAVRLADAGSIRDSAHPQLLPCAGAGPYGIGSGTAVSEPPELIVSRLAITRPLSVPLIVTVPSGAITRA